MRAAILRAPDDMVVGDRPDPVPARGDLVLRVRAATLCGTDIRILRGRKTAGIRYPAVIGHEFAGEVVEGGGTRFRTGERVAVNPAIPCGCCADCRRGRENVCARGEAIGYELDGAFAEFIRIPSRAVLSGNVHPLPDALGFEDAALAEPLACVLNGQRRVGVGVGDTVLVLGGGPIGLLHVILARLSGAVRIIVSERNASRREAALAVGADLALDARAEDPRPAVREATGGEGADVAIVAVGAEGLADLAVDAVRRGGRVSLFAGYGPGERAPLDLNAIHYREIAVTGAFGLSRADFDTALGLLARGRVRVHGFVGARFGLERIADAFAGAEGRGAIKVAIVSDGGAVAAATPPV